MTALLELRLPWPPNTLSPNRRTGWRRLAEARKKFRKACWGVTLEQLQRRKLRPRLPARVDVTLVFHPPTRPHFDHVEFDRDNLLARMKSGLDGVCDALQVNDKTFDAVTARVGERRGSGFDEVVVTFTAAASTEATGGD